MRYQSRCFFIASSHLVPYLQRDIIFLSCPRARSWGREVIWWFGPWRGLLCLFQNNCQHVLYQRQSTQTDSQWTRRTWAWAWAWAWASWTETKRV